MLIIYLCLSKHQYTTEISYQAMKTTLIFVLIFSTSATITDQTDYIELSGLPCHLTYVQNESIKGLVFFISGDGGYTSFDQSICNEFATKGFPVIGLDALKYFWKEKDTLTVVADVQKLLSYYKTYWRKSEFIFVGYSFGADAMPVIVNRLEAEFKSHTKIVGLLSPSASADLEIHIGDMLSIKAKAGQYD